MARCRILARPLGAAAIFALLAACARPSEGPAHPGSPGAAGGAPAAERASGGPAGATTPAPAPPGAPAAGLTAAPAPRIASLPHGEGARRMAARLAAIVRDMDPKKNIFLNTERVAQMRDDLAHVQDPRQQVRGLSFLADELLKTGQVKESIAITESFLKPGEVRAAFVPPPDKSREFLGLSYVRLGETENCIASHTPESCLLPIRGRGIYTRQDGPRRAMDLFEEVLRSNPNDLASEWLLNLAAMTLGKYPDGVPERWRIPPDTFRAEGDIGRFTDVAAESDLMIVGHAGGAVLEDFDGDGDLDLMVSSMGVRDPLRFFHNLGDGRFEDRTKAAGLEGLDGGLNLVHADYNNDGHPDVLVLRGGWMNKGGHFPNSLLRNNGDGTFDDVTEEAGIMTLHPTQTGSFADYDGDGWVDLVVGNESTPGDPNLCELWHNERDGTFRETTVDLAPADFGYVKGVVWGDYNNDGRPDLFVSVLDHPSRLFRNDGPRVPPGPHGEDWIFTDVTQSAGLDAPSDSFPAWFWDYDNDGWLDIMAMGFKFVDMGDVVSFLLGRPAVTQPPRLFHNNHDGTFTNVAHETRIDRVVLVMGSNFGDFDNDGWQDAWFGTGEPSFRSLLPNRLFHSVEGKRFEDVTSSAGVGNLQKGHAVATGDVDNDGDLDAFVEMGGWFESDVAHSNLFRNPGNANHWVTLRIEGRTSNRSAIGARLRVRVRTPAGVRDVYTVVSSGGSFGGGSLQRQIGLGQAQSIESIEITWPATGKTQTFRDVPMDRFYRVVEGESAPVPLTLRRIPL